MHEKKHPVCKPPDLAQMQAVVIDARTTIYIPKGLDPKEAKKRYFERLGVKRFK